MTAAMSTTKKPKQPKKPKKSKAPKLFPDELIDQLVLAEVQTKVAESILGESGHADRPR